MIEGERYCFHMKLKKTSNCDSEVEYIYGSNFFCIFYAVWLRIILETMHTPQKDNIEIFTENKSAISLGKKSIFYERSNHIDTKYHFIRRCISKKKVKMSYLKFKDQAVNILTKALKYEDLCRLRADLLGVI